METMMMKKVMPTEQRVQELTKMCEENLRSALELHLESLLYRDYPECSLAQQVRAIDIALNGDLPRCNGYYTQRVTATDDPIVNQLTYDLMFHVFQADDGCMIVDDFDMLRSDQMLEDGEITEEEYEYIADEMPNAPYKEPALTYIKEQAENFREQLRNELKILRRTASPGDLITYDKGGPGMITWRDGQRIGLLEGNRLLEIGANQISGSLL